MTNCYHLKAHQKGYCKELPWFSNVYFNQFTNSNLAFGLINTTNPSPFKIQTGTFMSYFKTRVLSDFVSVILTYSGTTTNINNHHNKLPSVTLGFHEPILPNCSSSLLQKRKVRTFPKRLFRAGAKSSRDLPSF